MTKQEFLAMQLAYHSYCILDETIIILTPSNYNNHYLRIKPILRPISDLTEACLPGGLIPIAELARIFNMNVVEYCFIEQNAHKYGFISEMVRLCVAQQLIEWHFDIAYLITTGDAIDYHTIEDFVF